MTANSATPYSLTSLLAFVPDWLGHDLFDTDRYSLPQIVPEDGVRQLRDAARRFDDSLNDFAERRFLGERRDEDGGMRRIFDDPMDQILGELRLRTMIRNEHQEEVRGRFRLLRDDCRRHAVEVVREACLAYAAEEKFFPGGYAEIRPYILKAQGTRSRLSHNLKQLAKEAERIAERRLRGDDEPVDPEEVRTLVEEMQRAARERSVGVGNEPRRKPVDTSRLRTPTADELASIAEEFNGAST